MYVHIFIQKSTRRVLVKYNLFSIRSWFSNKKSVSPHYSDLVKKKRGGGGFDSAIVFKQEVSVTVRVTLFGRHVESMMRAPTRFFASAMCLNLEFCFIAGTLARVRRRVHSMTGVSNYKSVMRVPLLVSLLQPWV